ncbi:hypothetical protein CPB86DRAFT_796699 [Serendipita vermifera]|nr:hypothetical protein CPB86DRAFT_796699 [Serendipita vermifera]
MSTLGDKLGDSYSDIAFEYKSTTHERRFPLAPFVSNRPTCPEWGSCLQRAASNEESRSHGFHNHRGGQGVRDDHSAHFPGFGFCFKRSWPRLVLAGVREERSIITLGGTQTAGSTCSLGISLWGYWWKPSGLTQTKTLCYDSVGSGHSSGRLPRKVMVLDAANDETASAAP